MRVAFVAAGLSLLVAPPAGAQRHGGPSGPALPPGMVWTSAPSQSAAPHGPGVHPDGFASGYVWAAPDVVRRLSPADRARLARYTAERDRHDAEIRSLDAEIGRILRGIERERSDRPSDPMLDARVRAFDGEVAAYLARSGDLMRWFERLTWDGASARERRAYLAERERIAWWGLRLLSDANRLQGDSHAHAHALGDRADRIRALTARGQAMTLRRSDLTTRRYIAEAWRRHILFVHGR